jgi:hypothetical protein
VKDVEVPRIVANHQTLFMDIFENHYGPSGQELMGDLEILWALLNHQ